MHEPNFEEADGLGISRKNTSFNWRCCIYASILFWYVTQKRIFGLHVRNRVVASTLYGIMSNKFRQGLESCVYCEYRLEVNLPVDNSRYVVNKEFSWIATKLDKNGWMGLPSTYSYLTSFVLLYVWVRRNVSCALNLFLPTRIITPARIHSISGLTYKSLKLQFLA